jgi:hypothetical protein
MHKPEAIMRQRSFAAWILSSLLLISISVGAAEYLIEFQSGAVNPAEFEYRLPLTTGATHAILQFFDPLSQSDRVELRANGVELLGFLPDRAYAVSLKHPLTDQALAALNVRAAIPFSPEFKIHPRVTEQAFGPWSEFENGTRLLSVEIFSDVSLEEAAAFIESAGFRTGHKSSYSHTILVAADPGKVSELASLDPVLFINEMSPPLESLNSTVRTRLHVNEVQAAPYNLSGEGVTILVYDGGLVDNTHPDFTGRVTHAEAGTVADHPTHVAGTVGGDGTASGGNLRGMAPAVTIVSGEYDACVPFCFYNSPNDVSPDYIAARQQFHIELTTNSMGANVSPNGYNCDWFGDYETCSRVLDQMVINTEDEPLIMFWAAGNERNDPGCNIGTYRCMSIPASAKNIMTIGATTSNDGMASFSSWGPTDDGRIKPEVVAMGVNVQSCAPGGGYQTMSGTSMATPASAGTACLVLEAWHNLYPNAPDPLPEAIKALYINAATDLGATGPDFQYGYGLVNALNMVNQLQAGGVLQAALSVGETFTRTFTVEQGTTILDVSLAWSDVPALGNVVPTLVNDLNLVLISPGNTHHLPWILNPANPGGAATTGHDSINVCERVRVSNPQAGVWTLQVTGDVNIGNEQRFALAASVPLVTQWTTISGRAYELGDMNAGLEGLVFAEGEAYSTLTESNGDYTIIVPSGVAYTINAVAYNHRPLSSGVVADVPSITLNFDMTIPATGTINGLVTNQQGTPLEAATVSFEFPATDIPSQLTNVAGLFSVTLPGANNYLLRAEMDGLSTETTVFLAESDVITPTLVIEDPRFSPVGPDEYGYYCYEIADTGLAPTYSYTSIAPAGGGSGTLITGTGNDWLTTINLPFTARFYGVAYASLTVAADGWIGFGAAAGGAQPWTNVGIPDADAPNGMISVFWDDLYPYEPTEGGQIAYFWDEPAGKFIVEYYEVPHFAPTTNHVTAQFVLYTSDVRPTVTNDNEIEVHYARFDYDGPDTDQDATLGIENSEGTTGLQVLFDGLTDTRQFPIAAQSALRYTTGIMSGSGTLSGQITGIPMLADMSTATLSWGTNVMHPNQDGSFSFPDVSAGQFRLDVQLEDYEHLQSDFFVIPANGEVTVNMTVYRLDPPAAMVGSFDPDINEIRLNWNPPTWGGQLRDPNGSDPLDGLTGYKIYRLGSGQIAQTSDTFFVYNPPGIGSYNMWITSVYDGGESDTSNHYRVIVTPVDDREIGIPDRLYLSQNYPNPFNPTTTIAFGLPSAGDVTLEVFDVQGRIVRTLTHGILQAGNYRVEFDGNRIGSGVYFYRLRASGETLLGKMMLIR